MLKEQLRTVQLKTEKTHAAAIPSLFRAPHGPVWEYGEVVGFWQLNGPGFKCSLVILSYLTSKLEFPPL